MEDRADQDFSYFLAGIRPVVSYSSVLTSSSSYLNEPAIREWIATHFLRKNGPDIPTPSDTPNGLIQALDRIRDYERLDQLIAMEKAKSPSFRLWLEERPTSHHTIADFAAYAEGSVGGIYYQHLVAHDFQLNQGRTLSSASDMQYIFFRSNQIHDFEHIITGGQFNTLGELLPYFVRLSNLHAHISHDLASALFPLHAFGAFRLVFRAALHYPAAWPTVVDLMRRGIDIGTHSACLLMARFEDVFPLTPERARVALGVRNAEDVDTSWASRIFDGAQSV